MNIYNLLCELIQNQNGSPQLINLNKHKNRYDSANLEDTEVKVGVVVADSHAKPKLNKTIK